MTNRIELEIACKRRKMTFESLAKAIGIAKQTMSLKINNKRLFNVNEINAISNVLGLSSYERDIIFFGSSVDKTSTEMV